MYLQISSRNKFLSFINSIVDGVFTIQGDLVVDFQSLKQTYSLLSKCKVRIVKVCFPQIRNTN